MTSALVLTMRFSHPNHFKRRCGFAFGPDLRQMTPAVEQAASRSEALAVTLFDSLPAMKGSGTPKDADPYPPQLSLRLALCKGRSPIGVPPRL
jgi:hypothetical protein